MMSSSWGNISREKAIYALKVLKKKQSFQRPTWSDSNRGDVASGYVKIAIEHGLFIVDLPIKDCDLP